MLQKDLIASIKEHLDKKEWDEAGNLLFSKIQILVSQRDSSKLDYFNDAFIRAILSPENVKKVVSRVGALKIFRRQVAELFSCAINKADKSPDVKALYFEFFYDGGDCCTGNIFLCTSYSEDTDEWASEFEDLVEGMNISEYFSYDPDFDFSPSESAAASYYISICLLKECAEAYFSLCPTKYPLGFANHDWGGMIRLTL